jgi:hypothetical protein
VKLLPSCRLTSISLQPTDHQTPPDGLKLAEPEAAGLFRVAQYGQVRRRMMMDASGQREAGPII